MSDPTQVAPETAHARGAMPVPTRAVASRIIRGTATLLHSSRDEIERLNPVGSFIWSKLLERTYDVEALSAEITREFEVDETTARADLEAFLQWLEARDLIAFESGADGG